MGGRSGTRIMIASSTFIWHFIRLRLSMVVVVKIIVKMTEFCYLRIICSSKKKKKKLFRSAGDFVNAIKIIYKLKEIKDENFSY